MKKQCTKCREEKDLSEFPPNKRTKLKVASSCRACNASAYRERYKSDAELREQRREYAKANADKQSVYRRRFVQRHEDAHTRYKKDKEKIRTIRKAYYKNPQNKIKQQARGKLRTAILNGSVIKAPCIVCGNDKSEAHHHDYNQPLDVAWLCKKHHRAYERTFDDRSPVFFKHPTSEGE